MSAITNPEFPLSSSSQIGTPSESTPSPFSGSFLNTSQLKFRTPSPLTPSSTSMKKPLSHESSSPTQIPRFRKFRTLTSVSSGEMESNEFQTNDMTTPDELLSDFLKEPSSSATRLRRPLRAKTSFAPFNGLTESFSKPHGQPYDDSPLSYSASPKASSFSQTITKKSDSDTTSSMLSFDAEKCFVDNHFWTPISGSSVFRSGIPRPSRIPPAERTSNDPRPFAISLGKSYSLRSSRSSLKSPSVDSALRGPPKSSMVLEQSTEIESSPAVWHNQGVAPYITASEESEDDLPVEFREKGSNSPKNFQEESEDEKGESENEKVISENGKEGSESTTMNHHQLLSGDPKLHTHPNLALPSVRQTNDVLSVSSNCKSNNPSHHGSSPKLPRREFRSRSSTISGWSFWQHSDVAESSTRESTDYRKTATFSDKPQDSSGGNGLEQPQPIEGNTLSDSIVPTNTDSMPEPLDSCRSPVLIPKTYAKKKTFISRTFMEGMGKSFPRQPRALLFELPPTTTLPHSLAWPMGRRTMCISGRPASKRAPSLIQSPLTQRPR